MAAAYSNDPQRKRIPKLEKSLAILLRSLVGTSVVIELKNDTEITGIIDETDEGMSVVLVDVTIVTFGVCGSCMHGRLLYCYVLFCAVMYCAVQWRQCYDFSFIIV
jgi:prophage tail gpP-like protein